MENVVTVADEDVPTELTPEGKRAELQAYTKTLKNRPIPGNYRIMSQSQLKVTVTPGKKEYNLELKR